MIRVNFFTIGGVRTRVLSSGNPESSALMLVHGGGLSADTWLHNIAELAQQHYVIAPDMLSHGFTDLVDFNESVPHPLIVDHLCSLADYLGWQEFSICGSSFGALISTLVALRLKQRVKKLIINGSGSIFNGEQELSAALTRAYENSSEVAIDQTTDSARARMAAVMYDGSKLSDALLLIQSTIYALPGMPQAWRSLLRKMMDIEATRPYRVLDRLEDITLPTLIVWGRQDPRGHLESMQSHLHRMPDAKLVILERCGHMPYLEDPTSFNEIAAAFLANSWPPESKA